VASCWDVTSGRWDKLTGQESTHMQVATHRRPRWGRLSCREDASLLQSCGARQLWAESLAGFDCGSRRP
jgi:hypothetical protein